MKTHSWGTPGDWSGRHPAAQASLPVARKDLSRGFERGGSLSITGVDY